MVIGAALLFHGPGDLDADICFDNFRVVPKVLNNKLFKVYNLLYDQTIF